MDDLNPNIEKQPIMEKSIYDENCNAPDPQREKEQVGLQQLLDLLIQDDLDDENDED